MIKLTYKTRYKDRPWGQPGSHLTNPISTSDECSDRCGKHEQGGGKNNGDNPCIIDFKGNIGGSPLNFFSAHNTSCILQRDASMPLDHKDRCDGDENKDSNEDKDGGKIHLSRFLGIEIQLLENQAESCWQRGQNADGNDQDSCHFQSLFR